MEDHVQWCSWIDLRWEMESLDFSFHAKFILIVDFSIRIEKSIE